MAKHKPIDLRHYNMESMVKVPNIRLKKNIDTEEDLKAELLDIYVLEEYMTCQEDFVAIYNHLFTVFVNCYPIKDLRNYTIQFKLYDTDKMVYGLPFKKFMLALPILGSLQLIWSRIKVDDHFIMVDYDSSLFNDLTDDVNYLLTEFDIPIKIRSAIITDTYYRYTQLAYTLADVLNITLSLDDYLLPMIHEQEMKELTDTPIPDDLQPADVKKEIARRSAAIKEIYKRVNLNGIGIILNSKTKLNERQFQEMNISHGQIPDIYGTYICRTMKNNGFNRGLETPGDFYLANTLSRYAAIINNNDMGDIGYFFRNVSTICGTVRLSDRIHDCKTNHLLKITVDDIQFIEGKYYKDSLSDKEFKVVKRFDKHLLGKTIYVRSAIYCACGDEICHMCYGADYKYVEDLPGMAIYHSQIITNPVYQGILSIKHAVDGDIPTIATNKHFNELFKLVENFIEPSDDIETADYAILIEKKLLDDMDYRSENFGLVTEPYIYASDGKELFKCEIENVQDLTYNPAIVKAAKPSKKFDGYYQVPMSILDGDGTITITLTNYGVSDVLKDFKKLIKYDRSDYSVDRYLSEIIAIVRRAKIHAKLIEIEIIMNRLIRDPDDFSKRPNYSNDTCKEVILAINKSVMNTKGVPVRLSYEQLKRQLLSFNQYDLFGDAYTQPLFELFHYTQNKDGQ